MAKHDMRGGCGNLIKYSFGFANLMLFIGGALLLGFGVAALTGDNSAFSGIISASLYQGTAILIIVAGSFVVLVSFFGCCGAFRDSRWMLATFFCLVFIMFILTMAAAITGFVFGGDAITTTLKDAMYNSLENYKEGDSAAVSAWDTVQQDFECCGVYGPRDYGLAVDDAPDSCYKDMDRNPVNKFYGGCFDQTLAFIEANSSLLGGIALGVSLFLLIAMICACFLMRTVE